MNNWGWASLPSPSWKDTIASHRPTVAWSRRSAVRNCSVIGGYWTRLTEPRGLQALMHAMY